MKRLILIYFCISLLTGSCVCHKSYREDYYVDPQWDSIQNAFLRAREEKLVSSEFTPSKYTDNLELQAKLLEFIYAKKWKNDVRRVMFQGNEDYADYINFDIKANIPPFKFECDLEVLKPASVLSHKDYVICKALDSDFVDSFNRILAGSSNQVLSMNILDDNGEPIYSQKMYLYGRVFFDVEKEIESYIIVNTSENEYISHSDIKSFLIIQNKEQILSILILNRKFEIEGYTTSKNRIIRLDDNVLVAQSEYLNEIDPEDFSIEEAERRGYTNYASFYVYEITAQGYIVGRSD